MEENFKSTEVLQNSLAFKKKLRIGEDAYRSLKVGKNLQGAWDAYSIGAGAAGLAKTSAVAGLVGTKVGPLAFLGIGTMATPLPYVALAAIGSTALYIGVMRKVRQYSEKRVVSIPEFINTPLDLLATCLFDLIAPAVCKMSLIDGEVSEDERVLISDYFVEEWGYSKDYVQESLRVIDDQIRALSAEDIFKPLVDFIKKNPDCNKTEISNDLIFILKEVAEVDGELKDPEIQYLKDASELLSARTFSIQGLISNLPKLRKISKNAPNSKEV